MQFFEKGGKDPFRLLPLVAATFPKGTAFGGGGKVSGSAIRRPLGGAVERSETEGVLGLTAYALSVIAARCHTPPFVAARHLPPERGKSFLKGRGKSTAESFSLHLKLQQRALDLGSPFGGAGAGAPERVPKKQNAQAPKNLCVMAGVVSFELTARGFGDRCSTS